MGKVIDLKISNIIIKDRLRDIDKRIIDDLSNSIKTSGLINPITVNQDNILISGFHRYTAVKKLGLDTIRCNVVDITNDDEMKLIEIDENLMRVELHYLDKAQQLVIRKEIYEKLHPSTALGAAGRGRAKEITNGEKVDSFAKDLSKKTNMGETSIYNLISLSNKLDKKAIKIIKKLEVNQSDTVKLSKLNKGMASSILKDMEQNKHSYAKALSEIKNKQKNEEKAKKLSLITLPSNRDFVNNIQIGKFEDIITKIPREIKYDCALVDIQNYVHTDKEQLSELEQILPILLKVVKKEGHFYFFSTTETEKKIKSLLKKNFKKIEEIIWLNNESINNTKINYYNKNFEMVFFCRNNNNKKLNSINSKCAISIDVKTDLIEQFVINSTLENELVFEPFVICGDTYKNCQLLNRGYFGIVKNKEDYLVVEKDAKGINSMFIPEFKNIFKILKNTPSPLYISNKYIIGHSSDGVSAFYVDLQQFNFKEFKKFAIINNSKLLCNLCDTNSNLEISDDKILIKFKNDSAASSLLPEIYKSYDKEYLKVSLKNVHLPNYYESKNAETAIKLKGFIENDKNKIFSLELSKENYKILTVITKPLLNQFKIEIAIKNNCATIFDSYFDNKGKADILIETQLSEITLQSNIILTTSEIKNFFNLPLLDFTLSFYQHPTEENHIYFICIPKKYPFVKFIATCE
ncbi:MAG: ParB N-terminal domain-containing protein [Arcobacteraceae bacterium]|nr:ParB N-terminal domain-containing protein [Arcobacteraceae bacterium]